MQVEYSKAGDVAYVKLNGRRVASTQELDAQRNVDYDSSGKVVGLEFLDVSDGVDLDDLPVSGKVTDRIEAALAKKVRGLKIYA